MSASRFLDRLLFHPRGRIILCNIIDGLDDGVFDEDIVRQLFDWWSTVFLHLVKRDYAGRLPKVREEKELIGSLHLVLFDKQAPGFRPNDNKPDFLLICMRKPRNTTIRTEFVNITQASGFIYRLLHGNERRELAATGGLAITDYPTGKEVLAFVSSGSHVVRLKPDSAVGRLGRVLWFTPFDQIDSDLAKGGVANAVRDRLGLFHYNNEDEALVALHLPSNVIEQIRNGRPTAADAGSHARFKSRADTAAMRRRRAWGYTVDLERLAGGKRNIDGLPERVCQPIPSGHLGKIRVTPLRPVTEIRGSTLEDNHEAFAKRLTRQHGGIDNIRTRILHVL